ncbi:DnaD domain protein [Tumebacillus lipolyticus]|uniref:DnaD domain protein n=1 Tax=Tumebacillus lipolyticus TaxID=1280370 RepID=A0ABW5A3K4_9BACL
MSDEKLFWIEFEQKWQELYGKPMTQSHYQMLTLYLEDGLTIEVMLLAISDAETYGAQTQKYLWKVFGTMLDNGVKTTRDYVNFLRSYEEAGQQKMAAAAGGGSKRGKRQGTAGTGNGSKVVDITGGKTGWISR